MRLVLFDVDGTLLLTHGAGMRAFDQAFMQQYGLADAMSLVCPDGKTDPQIAREALAAAGRQMGRSTDELAPLFEKYTALLEREMADCSRLRVLPGVRELLTELHGDRRFCVGLATGNIASGAWLKLRCAGLDSFFQFGGFGSDAEDRTELIRTAIRRGAETIAPRHAEAVFVVGDTPRDILHGRAAGARTIAVAGGNYSVAELASFGPDLAVAAFDPPGPVLNCLRAAV
jgi:phosphoglycolate phosphatase-like HAD superfamily hydrolase